MLQPVTSKKVVSKDKTAESTDGPGEWREVVKKEPKVVALSPSPQKDVPEKRNENRNNWRRVKPSSSSRANTNHSSRSGPSRICCTNNNKDLNRIISKQRLNQQPNDHQQKELLQLDSDMETEGILPQWPSSLKKLRNEGEEEEEEEEKITRKEKMSGRSRMEKFAEKGQNKSTPTSPAKPTTDTTMVRQGASLLPRLELRLLFLPPPTHPATNPKKRKITPQSGRRFVLLTDRPLKESCLLKKGFLRPLFRYISIDFKSTEDHRNFPQGPGVITLIS